MMPGTKRAAEVQRRQRSGQRKSRLAAQNGATRRRSPPPSRTLHGLRRPFSSLAGWTEVPSGIKAQIMGHKPSAIAERHYNVGPLDLLRMWHDTLEAWILKGARIDFKPERNHQGLQAVRQQCENIAKKRYTDGVAC